MKFLVELFKKLVLIDQKDLIFFSNIAHGLHILYKVFGVNGVNIIQIGFVVGLQNGNTAPGTDFFDEKFQIFHKFLFFNKAFRAVDGIIAAKSYDDHIGLEIAHHPVEPLPGFARVAAAVTGVDHMELAVILFAQRGFQHIRPVHERRITLGIGGSEKYNFEIFGGGKFFYSFFSKML